MNMRDALLARMPDTIRTLRNLATVHAPDAVAQREAGFHIFNAKGDAEGPAVVRIYDEVWDLGVNAQTLIADLDAIAAPEIRVEINSPGGNVFDGIAIYNALRNHPSTVTTRVDGLAASIASIIAQAGDVRVMQPSAQMMIHNAWAISMGDHQDHAEMAALLEQQDAVLANIYASRSGRDVSVFRDLMDAETWLTADRAVAEGLADSVVDAPKKAASKATLLDDIVAAMDVVTTVVESAERVVALRAEAGKDLSNVVRESLAGLADITGRLNALAGTEPPVPTVEPEAPETAPEGPWSPEQVAARLRYLDRLEAVSALII